MGKHRSLFLLSLASLFACGACNARQKYEMEPPPEFLFEPKRAAVEAACSERNPGMKPPIGLRPGNQAPYARIRKEEIALTRNDVPALTVTSDPYNSVDVAGISGADWKLSFCATGEGDSESEAEENLSKIALERLGNSIVLKNPLQTRTMKRRGYLSVEAPQDVPLVIHASYSAVSIIDMKGPVKVAASHARAKLLNTSGEVSAMAQVVDFAASHGDVDLNADFEINLKMTATRFTGHLMASAQHSVRLLVPPGFKSSFRAAVNRADDFVCQADFCEKIKHEKQNNLHVFRYAGEDRESNGTVLELRSEEGAVVIYGMDRLAKK
jgi:hypothetical protein